MAEKNKHLTLNQAADYLGVSYWTLRRYVKKGDIPYTLVPNKWRRKEYRFKVRDLEAFTSGGKPGAKEGAMADHDSILKKYITRLEEENAFLREQMHKKDSLLEANMQIVGRLTHQTEVLMALAQGVDIQMLIRGDGFAGMSGAAGDGPGQDPDDSVGEGRDAENGPGGPCEDDPQAQLRILVKKLAQKGLDNDNIAVFLNKRGIGSLDPGREWDAGLVEEIAKS